MRPQAVADKPLIAHATDTVSLLRAGTLAAGGHLHSFSRIVFLGASRHTELRTSHVCTMKPENVVAGI